MSKEVKVTFRGDDKASEVAKKVNKSISGVGSTAMSVFKKMGPLLAAGLVAKVFKDAVKAGTEADAGLKQSFSRIGDYFRGFQVSLLRSVVSNKDFMDSLMKVAQVVLPFTIGMLQNAMTIVNKFVSAIMVAVNALKMAWNWIRNKDNSALKLESKNLLSGIFSTEGFVNPFSQKITPVTAPKTGGSTKKKAQPLGALEALFGSGPMKAGLARGTEHLAGRGEQWLALFGYQDKVLAEAFEKAGPFPKAKDKAQKAFLQALGRGEDWALQAEFEQNILPHIQEAFSSTISEGIISGFTNGIETAISSSSIGEGLKALAGTMVSALGSAFQQVGQIGLAGSILIQKLQKALAEWKPGKAIAVSVGLIALGSVLKGASQRIFSGMGGASQHGTLGYDRVSNMANSFSGRPVNITIVGDPYFDMTNREKAQAVLAGLGHLGNQRLTINYVPR